MSTSHPDRRKLSLRPHRREQTVEGLTLLVGDRRADVADRGHQLARPQRARQRRDLPPQHRPPVGDLHRAVPARELRAPDRQHDPVRVHGRDHRPARGRAAGPGDRDRDRRRGPRHVADRPGDSVTVGASGVVFGYATYLLTRGLFNRSVLELLTGVVVGVVWGGACCRASCRTTASPGRRHACGAVGRRRRRLAAGRPRPGTVRSRTPQTPGDTAAPADPLARALAK